jgi:hypothetical protein
VPYIDLKKTSYKGASIPESNATEKQVIILKYLCTNQIQQVIRKRGFIFQGANFQRATIKNDTLKESKLIR